MILLSRLSWLSTVPGNVGGALLGVPEALAGLRALPELVERLDDIAEATSTLPELNATLKEVSRHTVALPALKEQLDDVTAATVSMERHTAQILETIPSLTALERTLPAFSVGLTELTELLREFERTVNRLAVVIEPLQGAAERLGRFSDRLSRRSGPRP